MVYDASLKEKAREMYVTSGLTVPSISSLLPGISQATLFKWRRYGNWEKQRKDRVAHTAARREQIERVLNLALDALEAKLDPKLAILIDKLVAALKSTSTFEFTEETKPKIDNKKKGLTPEALKEIEEKLGIF
jgi:transposase-like protein